MTAEEKVRALAKERGLELHVKQGSQWEEISCAAPDKQVWKSTGTHEVVCAGSRGQRIGPDFWEAILSDIQDGSEPCENDPCDWCEK